MMNKLTIIAALLIVIVGLALFVSMMMQDDEDRDDEEEDEEEEDEEEEGNETAELMAQYTLVFEATWSKSTHPYDFPSNPHFSGLIGATHNDDVSFWAEGGLASAGIKNVAETGRKNPFNSEIDDAISAKTAYNKLSGGGISSSPGSTSITFNVSRDFPLVTVISMIAPSPDWFVGVSGLSLLEKGGWVDEQVVDLYLFDAGTDSGTSYASANAATTPPVLISPIDDSVLSGSSKSFGTFTFTRIDG
jgi:hypothetical protein